MAASPPHEPHVVRHPAARALVYALLVLAAVFFLLPSFIVVTNVFRNAADVAQHGFIALPRSFSFEPFISAWTRRCVSGTCEGVARNFLNSLIITVPATLITTALGLVNGYVLTKWRFRGSDLFFVAVLLGVFMPFQTSLLPWAWVLSNIGLYNNVYGLLLINCVQGISFATVFCRAFFVHVPDDLVRAAQLDGAGFWRIFLKVMLPLSPPILIVTLIWQFTFFWNDYLYGMVFTTGTQQPITVALMGAGRGSQSAAVLIGALPPLLLFLFGGRYFTRIVMRGAVAGM
ncbi:MAG: carbohydrate ABC transporter permease [Hyphomicrobiaceae bacterium]|nr:carbohydrate ABC transporter permease [Hyphomicrobiaceae bacterium]